MKKQLRRMVYVIFPLIILATLMVSKTASSSEKNMDLDPAVVEKVHNVFSAIYYNDDKKGKVAYGRGYRFMPEFLQFAFDLRLRNYVHALSLLHKLPPKGPEEPVFWEKILKNKPVKLYQEICQELSKGAFPDKDLALTIEEKTWATEASDWMVSLQMKEMGKQETPPTVLDQELEKVSCQTQGSMDQWKCEPLSEDLQKSLLNDGFLDKLHNMQRRDIRDSHGLYRNPAKLARYQYYVKETNIYKVYLALKATDSPRQMHFIRRLKGIARDMRRADLLGRVLGNKILGDEKDAAFSAKLVRFFQAYPLVIEATRMSLDLASCNIPER